MNFLDIFNLNLKGVWQAFTCAYTDFGYLLMVLIHWLTLKHKATRAEIAHNFKSSQTCKYMK